MLIVRRVARHAVVLGALGLVLAMCPIATAAQTFGSNLNATPTGTVSVSTVTATVANDSLPVGSTAPGTFTSPIDGVVTRWRIKVGAETDPIALQITRPGNSGTRTSVATSGTVTPPANATSTFETQLPVQEGDALALGFPDGSSLVVIAPSVGGNLIAWIPRLQDGEPPRGSDPLGSDIELLINADVEPDCDEDGFGDETQDPNPACPRTLTLDANKNKVRKGKRVTLSGQVTELARQACQSGQAVELQRRKPSQTTFTTFQQLTTDATGSFSSREKVKKTFEYRAQLAETTTCGTAVSNTETVKAKKKK
jgi:hypothetical protein